MDEERYDAERKLAGDLSVLSTPATSARLAGTGVAQVLEAFRTESPDDPLWTGVQSIEPGQGHVDVTFKEALEPRPLPVGDVQVECHLYDEEALAKAAASRSTPSA